MKPHNPAADIDSLEHGRNQLANALGSQQFRLDELSGRQPIRHRRERTAERLSVEHAVENLQRQLDSTDDALNVARGQQGAYHKYANKYGKELARLDVIGYEIEAKVERLVTSYRDDPPAYLAALGPHPYDGNKRWRWDDDAPSSNTDTNTTSRTNTSRSANRAKTTTNNDTLASGFNKPAENSPAASAANPRASKSSSSP